MIKKNSTDIYPAKAAYQDTIQASTYDQKRFSSLRGKVGNYLDQRALAQALAKIPRTGKDALRVLDIPCGTGRMTKFLLDKGEKVIGADISAEMMGVAREKVQNHANFEGFFQEDAAQLTFPNDSFDCVISIRFIGHIPKDVRISILKEFARVSQFAIIEYSINSRLARLRLKIEGFLKTGIKLPKRWSWHVFDRQELTEELKLAGFEIIGMWAKLPGLSDSNYVLLQRQKISS